MPWRFGLGNFIRASNLQLSAAVPQVKPVDCDCGPCGPVTSSACVCTLPSFSLLTTSVSLQNTTFRLSICFRAYSVSMERCLLKFTQRHVYCMHHGKHHDHGRKRGSIHYGRAVKKTLQSSTHHSDSLVSRTIRNKSSKPVSFHPKISEWNPIVICFDPQTDRNSDSDLWCAQSLCPTGGDCPSGGSIWSMTVYSYLCLREA